MGALERAVESALDKRVFVLMCTVIFSAAGIWAFLTMRVDAVPDISNVQVTVTATARGLAPTEVEQYITYPIELSLQSLPKLKLQRSISKYALSQVTVVFDDGTDIYWARQQVSERLKGIEAQMPPNNEIKIMLGPIATGLGEVFQFEVKGPGYSLMQLRDILDWRITPMLKTISGIDEIQSMGGEVKEYQVWLDPEKLHGYKVTPTEVCAALMRSNGNTGGGYVLQNDDQILLRAEGMLAGTRDIGNVVVRRSNQGALRVKDFASAVVGHTLPQSVVTANGAGETVIGIIIMRKGEDSKTLVTAIKKRLESIQKALPANVTIHPFYDRSTLIDRTIETVEDNLTHGALLVLLVLLVLLGSLRGGIIAALSIPLALFGSLLFLNQTGISGNLLSLGAIDFGILIDGSVVMVENILRRLSHATDKSAANRLRVIKEAAMEVAAPVMAAVLIITVVYLPILGLPGVSGKTFQPMALTVVFGLLTALVVALFVTPALSYFILGGKIEEKDSWVIAVLKKPYRRLLIQAVRHPMVTSGIALLLFVGSLGLLPLLGTEFIPVLKEGSLVLTVNRPMSGSLRTAARQTDLIEKVLLENKNVESVVSRTGHSEIAFDPMGPDETDVLVIFKPPHEWPAGYTQQTIENEIDRALKANVPGLIFSMSQPIEQRMNELVAGAKSDVAIRVFGDDIDRLREIGQKIGRVVAGVKGSMDLKTEQTAGLPVMTAKLDPMALASYGVYTQDALTTFAAAVDGKPVGMIYEGKPRYPLVVRFSPESVSGASKIADLPVATATGELVPLSQLASIKQEYKSAQLAHYQGDRTFMVQTNVRGRDLGGFVAEARSEVERQIQLPEGYRIEWGGQFENMKVAQDRLLVLVPLSLVLIFALLYMLFNDWRPGVLIFINIPLAFSGGLIALYCRHMALSITAGVGFIALFGVAVLNGVVLVSTIQNMRGAGAGASGGSGVSGVSGLRARQAALLGAQQRLRPVLMTALVASLGFIPMAVATSVGAEVQRPLATVVIAGLVSSTLLTLLVLPSLYPLICGKMER
jgi:heavy metal efflux system protein